MIKKRNIENIYIAFLLLVWALYSCYSMFVGEDKGLNISGGFTPLFAVFSFVLSLPYLFANFLELFCKRKHGKVLSKWIFYFFYVSIVVLLLYENSNINGIIYNEVQVLLPLAVMLVMYLYIRRNGVTDFFLVSCLCVFFILVLQYFRLYTILNALIDAHIGGAYYPLFLLPVLLLIASNKLKYVVILVVLCVLLSSLKRGGLVAFGLGLLAYIVCDNMISVKQGMRRISLSVFFIVVLISAFLWMDTYNDDSIIERFSMIQDDEGSGRIGIWKQTWFMIINSSGLNFLFGHGYNAVVRDSPLFFSAHNDLLEIWYDYGLIGLLLFLIAMFSWLKLMHRLYVIKYPLFPHLAMLAMIVAVLMMISHVVIYPWMIWVCFSLGTLVGKIDARYN